MNWLSSLTPLRRAGVGLAVLASVIYAASIVFVTAADTKAADTKPAHKVEKKAVKKLTGAELYSMNCNRCHPERYPMEWNSTEWKTLVTHMRVRANLPAWEARKILKYLQEDSGK
ncbi:MAG TPA: cytochrome c [Verrucomicrobiae bacterium]|nr:cytochrome c [Verrucomicrobiae bacterium]